MYKSSEQELVDICFSCVLTVLDKQYHSEFMKMTTEEKAAWVAKQLKECGFPTKPMGASWGVLTGDFE